MRGAILVDGPGLVGGGIRPAYTVGVLQETPDIVQSRHPFLATRYMSFVPVAQLGEGVRKVSRHQLDLLVDLDEPVRYWINPTSPKGYFVEFALLQSATQQETDRIAKLYARKLHKLRHCPIIIQYYTRETIRFRRTPITVLISEYVEGERLSDFLSRQRGRRLMPFQAAHLLYALAKGMEQIHHAREYHGDLHTDNIIINRYGLGFDLKVIDFYHWKDSIRENIAYDIVNMIRVFYEVLGGARHYARLPDNIKWICCGLKKSLILKKFPTTAKLREHLESMEWD